MKSNFQDCVNRVLQDEGGYTNDPNDSGGPTNYGITQREVKQDVRTLTVDQAKSIYKTKYWDAVSADSLPSGVDYTCFDYAVNSGVGRPKKALQTFKSKSGVDLINAINDERTAFLRKIGVGKNSKFLKGWLSRVNRVRLHSLEMAKKDNLSGPLAGVATGATALAALRHWFAQHQTTLVITGVVIGAVVVGYIIHKIRNKNG